MKVIASHYGNTSYSAGVRSCGAYNCVKSTREGKPYCPKHYELNSYADKVLKEIAKKVAEDAVVLDKSTAPSDYNIDGITARSVLQKLKEVGTRTRAKLCRELSVKPKVLDGYTKALVRAKLVVEGRTNRGGGTLSLHP